MKPRCSGTRLVGRQPALKFSGCGRGRATTNLRSGGFPEFGAVVLNATPSTAVRTMASSGVSELLKSYKGVLLDQFGVLHDGQVPYPAAIDAVKHMHAAGIRVYILSNSSRRSTAALDKISAMGFPRECFAGAMTSGEVTHRGLSTRPTPEWRALGSKCLHFTWSGRGAVDIDSLGLTLVTDPADADFVLAHGTEALGDPTGEAQAVDMARFEALLDECAALGGRPMVVANPDIVTVDGSELRLMPGSLGKYYAARGGEVRLMGKPDAVIYAAAMAVLQCVPSELLAIGDSVEHDIAGAHAAGVDTLFIGGGIHTKEVPGMADASQGGALDLTAVQQWCSEAFPDVKPPTFAMPFLTW